MANIVITATLASLGGAAPKNFTFFKDEDKKAIVAAPVVENGTATWTVPDTPENQNLFKRNFGSSGPFRLKPEGKAAPVNTGAVPATIAGTASTKSPPKGSPKPPSGIKPKGKAG